VLPVAPSAVPIPPELRTMTGDGKVVTYETPRPLETGEIPGIVEASSKPRATRCRPDSTASKSTAPTAI
jgi:hypothetical protein